MTKFLHEKGNEILIEITDAFVWYYKLFLSFMGGAADWKKRYDETESSIKED